MIQEENALRTKEMFANALKQEMRRKPVQKITVTALSGICGVNRKTFYYHFEDIYALLKWMLEREAVEIVKNFDLMVDYEEAIAFVMDYVEANDYILNCAYDSLGRDALKQFFQTDFREVTECVIRAEEEDAGRVLEEPYRTFVCDFLISGLAELLIEWIRNPKMRNRTDITDYVVWVLHGALAGILSENRKRPPFLQNGHTEQERPL